eukprot:CAMPEP_0172709166 /NCGR_PEP_ID=MMETSP1074-20121228/53638_1 /TAXON_ID=2916 /ORGANISM="Ceratium fusus, Strain PA161109" /LENGTH=53 /DNA_ID=CAMNT_0013532335 /DNA_START=1 /DNA_END=158 /DNA_ORIENTATION=+
MSGTKPVYSPVDLTITAERGGTDGRSGKVKVMERKQAPTTHPTMANTRRADRP